MWSLMLGAALAAPRWDVSVEPVAELCLLGSADAAWASALLAPEGLAPELQGGRALLSICGSEARFGGRVFREGILGLQTTDGLYLVWALNSIPSYAWVERKRNRSPYETGHVALRADHRGALLEIGVEGRTRLSARGPALQGKAQPRSYAGRIHQPGHSCFEAELVGDALLLPFGPGSFWSLGPPDHGLVQGLAAADFQPEQWMWREAGRHSKTRTMDRP
jgi:hypothetical protein